MGGYLKLALVLGLVWGLLIAPLGAAQNEPPPTAALTEDTPTDTVTSSVEDTLTPSPTPSPETTDEPTEVVSTETLTPTETSTPALVEFKGRARYQNRLPNHSGILITILDGDLQLVSETVTGPDGRYIVLAPPQEFFWLVVTAPLHRRFEIGIWPGETLPDVELAGGDLDGDGCIGPLDMVLLTAQYLAEGSPETDITNDGVTDASDLAMLGGNYNPDLCPENLAPTPTPTLTATPTLTETPTPIEIVEPEVTPTEAPTASATAAEMPTFESTDETGTGGEQAGDY